MQTEDERVSKMDADQFYKGKSGGKYLKADALEGQEWELTISGYERGGPDDFYPIYLKFEEIKEIWGLNKTNYGMVKENTGSSNTDDWVGKKIIIYGTRDSNKEGKMVNVIRVRPPQRDVKRVVPGTARPSKAYDERNPPPFSDEVPF